MARLVDQRFLQDITAKATSAITTAGLFVKFDTDEENVVVAGAGDAVLGVLPTIAAASEYVSVVTGGAVRVRLGGTVADKSFVQSDANAKAVQAACGHIAGYMPVGGASGELRTIFLGQKPSAGIVGAAVASAAAIVPTGHLFHVTGTTNITSITATGVADGTVIRIVFDGSLTFTDGSNLKLAGNFSTSADDTISLVYSATDTAWFELARSAN